MIMKVLGMAVLAVATVMAATSGTWASGGSGKGGTKLRAVLVASVTGGAKIGEAEYTTKLKNGIAIRRLEVEVDQLASPVGTVLKILVNGVSVGTATVVAGDADNDGPAGAVGNEAKLVLQTPKNTVPTIVVGSTITICDPNGIVFASGTF